MTSKAARFITQLMAEIAERDARIAGLLADVDEWQELAARRADIVFAQNRELAALKAQKPSTGVVDERAAFEAWYSEHYYEGDESCTRQWLFREPCGNYRHEHASRDWRTWQARARLNPCRAQAVPEQVREAGDTFEGMSEGAKSTVRVMVDYCLNARVCLGMDEGFKSFYPEIEHDFVLELHKFAAAPSAKKESGDE